MINIAVLSAKGGSGKTTLSIALAHEYSLANRGREIVLVDADNQGNVGLSLNLRAQNTLGSFLYGVSTELDLLRYREDAPFYVVDSGRLHLYEAERKMHQQPDSERYFGEKVLPQFQEDSLVIWDLPPTLSLINDNVLLIADYVVIPTHTDFLSLTGIGNLLGYLEHFKRKHPVARCHTLGIAITLHREHVTQNRMNKESLDRTFPDLMFQTTIPLSTAIATTAQNHLTPLEAQDSRAQTCYKRLVQQIHQRMLLHPIRHG